MLSVPKRLVSISARAASRFGALRNVLYFSIPALFTSRLTSAHCRATCATRAASVMSMAMGVTPGSVTMSGWRAAP